MASNGYLRPFSAVQAYDDGLGISIRIPVLSVGETDMISKRPEAGIILILIPFLLSAPLISALVLLGSSHTIPPHLSLFSAAPLCY
jgi:hypothetical protein